MNSQELKCRKGGCLFKLVKLTVLAIVILAVALYFSIGYVADYGLKTITAGTGIDAGVGSVKIGIIDQEVSVTNFFITNPPDYKKGNAFAFKTAYINTDISPFKLMGQKTVVVDEVRVEGLFLNIDLRTGTGVSALLSAPKSNLTEIADILQTSLGVKASSQEAAKETDSDEAAAEPMRFIVKKIVFAEGKVSGSFNSKGFEFPLPSFTVENLGVREDGLTGGELMVKLTALIGTRVTVDSVKYLAGQAISLGGDAVNTGGDAAGGATKAAGDAAKDVTNALKSLF